MTDSSEPHSDQAKSHWGSLPSLFTELAPRGDVWELSHEFTPTMPMHPRHPRYTMALHRRHGDIRRENGYSFANEQLSLSAHSGTHIDAIGHVSLDNRLFGGSDAEDVQRGEIGLKTLGADELPPFIGRGIVLDVAGHRGVEEMEPGEPISGQELNATALTQNIAIRPNDSIFIRTGWAQRWSDPGRFVSERDGQPGPDADGASWLAAQRPLAVGSDTMMFEAWHPTARNGFPAHTKLLVDGGIPIIEMLDLEEVCATRSCTFLFIALPLRLQGATGSPIRAIAIT